MAKRLGPNILKIAIFVKQSCSNLRGNHYNSDKYNGFIVEYICSLLYRHPEMCDDSSVLDFCINIYG